MDNIIKDEGCGIDGHGEHVWRYGVHDNAKYITRTCSFCNEEQESPNIVIWCTISQGTRKKQQ